MVWSRGSCFLAGCKTDRGTRDLTALHDIPVGEVWSTTEIRKRISSIEESNRKYAIKLHWNVVESLPVHKCIKQGRADRDVYIENYKKSLRNVEYHQDLL